MSEQERAPYGRQAKKQRGLVATRRYEGEDYYGTPALKPSIYGWLIAVYFLIGGVAGASAIIAAVVDGVGRERDRVLVRAGRYMALLGASLSPIFLIADLHTPQRFYNMLRIFRKSSPLSFGTWTLVTFSFFSALSALAEGAAQFLGVRAGERWARWLGLPAALAGAMMTVYTATVLTATSIPLWAAARRPLPMLFASAAMSNATAALSLVLEAVRAPLDTRHRLERLSLVAALVELVASLRNERAMRARGVAAPLDEPKRALAYWGGAWGLGLLVPHRGPPRPTDKRHASPLAGAADRALDAGGRLCAARRPGAGGQRVGAAPNAVLRARAAGACGGAYRRRGRLMTGAPWSKDATRALHKLDEALQTPAPSVKPVLSEAERALVLARDQLILQLREQPNTAERLTLAQINAILSLVYGAGNPVGGIQWEYVRQARDGLAHLLRDAEIA